MTLIKRLTLDIDSDRIEKVFYPVGPPGENAEKVVARLSGAAYERARQ